MAGGAPDLDNVALKNADRRPGNPQRAVALERFFTSPGRDPMNEVDWELRTAVITGEDGRVVFEQGEVEVPRAWSQTATNVVVSKYFRGPIGVEDRKRHPSSVERESSVRQRISRVVETVTGWGDRQGYFGAVEERETFRA